MNKNLLSILISIWKIDKNLLRIIDFDSIYLSIFISLNSIFFFFFETRALIGAEIRSRKFDFVSLFVFRSIMHLRRVADKRRSVITRVHTDKVESS